MIQTITFSESGLHHISGLSDGDHNLILLYIYLFFLISINKLLGLATSEPIPVNLAIQDHSSIYFQYSNFGNSETHLSWLFRLQQRPLCPGRSRPQTWLPSVPAPGGCEGRCPLQHKIGETKISTYVCTKAINEKSFQRACIYR